MKCQNPKCDSGLDATITLTGSIQTGDVISTETKQSCSRCAIFPQVSFGFRSLTNIFNKNWKDKS